MARLRELQAAGAGWINFRPVLGDHDIGDSDPPPARPGLFGLMSTRGPAVPVCTVVVGGSGRRGPEPDSLGIQHPAGVRARQVLPDAGVTLPDGWVLRSDHPRRGLVVEAPSGTDAEAEVTWLIRAARALAEGPLPDAWAATVHTG